MSCHVIIIINDTKNILSVLYVIEFKKNRCNNILLQFKKKKEYYCPYVRKKNIKYIFEKREKVQMSKMITILFGMTKLQIKHN